MTIQVPRYIVMLLLMSSSVSSATSQIDRDIVDIFAASTNVLEGEVERLDASCNDRGCRSKIEITVEASYKGKVRSGERASFCSNSPLSIGSRFIFFVEESHVPSQDGCSGYVERDGVFERFSEKVYRYMSPSSFEIAQINGVKYLTGWVEEKDFDKLLIDRDVQDDEDNPSFDAALVATILALAAFSETCSVDDSIRDDPDITGTLYANNYQVLERSKFPAGANSLYRYTLRGKKHEVTLRVEIMISSGACTKLSVEKIASVEGLPAVRQ